MFIRFFKSNQAATLFAIPLLALVLWTGAFFHPGQNDNFFQGAMPFYTWVMALISFIPKILQTLLAVSLVSFQSIYLNGILSKHEVLYKRSYLPSLFYLVFACSLPSFLSLHPVLFVNTILLLILDKLFRIYKNDSVLPLIFDAGFLIALSSLFYFSSIVIFLLAGLALIILRPFAWREWVAGCIGLGLPYFFISIYFFWTGGFMTFWVKTVFVHFTLPPHFILAFQRPQILLLSFISILLVISFLKVRANLYKNVIRTRNYQLILLWMMPVFCFSFFLEETIYPEHFSLFVAPLAVFISYYFLASKRNFILELVFALFVSLLVYNHLIYFR